MTNSSCDLAVVLSGGGARAAYQVGVLAAIAERYPGATMPIITGVSAGAINATYLAAHHGPLPRAVNELRGQWLRLTSDRVYRLPTAGVMRTLARIAGWVVRRHQPPTVRGLLDMRPLAHFLREVIAFGGIEERRPTTPASP